LTASRFDSVASLATRPQIADVQLQLWMAVAWQEVIYFDGWYELASTSLSTVLAVWRLLELGSAELQPGC
jgi:hypothetical protein